MKITTSHVVRSTAVAMVATLAMASCGGSDDADSPSIEGAWARTSPMSTDNGAVYFEITSDEADSLIGVSVDDDVAAEAQIHETSMMDGHDEDSMDDDSMDDDSMDDDSMDDDSMDEDSMDDDSMDDDGGVMQMVEIGRLELPAGETVELAPGGYHIMLLGLAEPLESGDSFDLTLDFETAPDTVLTVEVSDSAPE